ALCCVVRLVCAVPVVRLVCAGPAVRLACAVPVVRLVCAGPAVRLACAVPVVRKPNHCSKSLCRLGVPAWHAGGGEVFF
ncbi:hypothetical protein, partial [Actinotignum sanguinis]|uniref:hypothetical protein n=1 Tax=Actinotignum sanguinis TaxID=1445614 RepID=UPI00254FDD76